MSTGDTNEFTAPAGPCTDAAAYVLGVLDPAAQAGYVEHAQGCPRCRREVGELAGLLPLLSVGALDRAAAASFPAPAMPPHLLHSARPPRGVRTRWVAAAALAAVLALVVVGLGVFRFPTPTTPLAGSAPASSTPPAALVRSFPGLGAAAVEVAVRRTDSGSSLSVRCTGAVEPDPTSATPEMVSLWVWTHTGRQVEVTAWTDMHAATTIDSSTSVIPEDMSMLELRGPDGHRLSRVDI